MQGVCALMAAHTAWLHIVAVHARLVGATVCLALRTTATPVVVVLRAHHNTTNASAYAWDDRECVDADRPRASQGEGYSGLGRCVAV